MRFNSLHDLTRHVSDQLVGYDAEIYGYNSQEAFESAVSFELLRTLREHHGFNYATELDDYSDKTWDDVLDACDKNDK